MRRGVLAVDVEVEFSPMYEDQPLFAEVDKFLRLFDLQPSIWHPDARRLWPANTCIVPGGPSSGPKGCTTQR